ncbi:DNA cytosine methyltransferase [Catenulispora pinisilvae]|uniref:DNA cytosine methyltransferase n=1 Tax=Catenulispora pinisilvae TaxID=2705253 RepID=UPI0018920E0A|nr:DNA (cytosine-5-)-methyltransferase [Catenulispora pinisilvae]
MAEGHRVYTSVEICAGAGGQAVGLEAAGFEHAALVEIDPHACATLRVNRPEWNVIEGDVREFKPIEHIAADQHIDLLAGGVPCPPFSLAGKQEGPADARDLFPAMLELVEQINPSAVMIENVRGLLQEKFRPYREWILQELKNLGYVPMDWAEFQASQFGVPQLRPRSILVALKPEYAEYYTAPIPDPTNVVSVGAALRDSMRKRGLTGADLKKWTNRANQVAPTLVGGSKKHGGADLGPTRAKRQWELMGVDGHGLADDGEAADLIGPKERGPKLTVAQAALLQGFPAKWKFTGGKTARYRQVGNAFPPPVAGAVAHQIMEALKAGDAAAQLASGDQVPPQRSVPHSPEGADAPSSEEPASLPQ